MPHDREGANGLSLSRPADRIAIFHEESRKTYPETRIGLITNLANGHDTYESPGMLETWPERNGVDDRNALRAVRRTARVTRTRPAPVKASHKQYRTSSTTDRAARAARSRPYESAASVSKALPPGRLLR